MPASAELAPVAPVDLDQMPGGADTGAAQRFGLRPGRVGVAAESCLRKGDAADQGDDERDDGQPGNTPDPPGAQSGGQVDGNVGDIDAFGDQQCRTEGHPESSQGDNEGWDFRDRDEEAVQEAPRQPGEQRDEQAE